MVWGRTFGPSLFPGDAKVGLEFSRFGIQDISEFYGSTEGNSQIINFDNTVGAVGFVPVLFASSLPLGTIKVLEKLPRFVSALKLFHFLRWLKMVKLWGTQTQDCVSDARYKNIYYLDCLHSDARYKNISSFVSIWFPSRLVNLVSLWESSNSTIQSGSSPGIPTG